MFPNEIKTFTDAELWEKFVLFFVKENHSCSNFDIQEEMSHSNNSTHLNIRKPSNTFDFDIIEDEPLISRVLTESYKIKKN